MVRSPPPPRRPAPPRPATGESKPAPKHIEGRSRCWKCGQYGHWVKDCPRCEWEKGSSKGAGKKKKGSKRQESAARGEYGARGFLADEAYWEERANERELRDAEEPAEKEEEILDEKAAQEKTNKEDEDGLVGSEA